MIVNKLVSWYMQRKKPVEYARKCGVKVGKDCRILGRMAWGTEPWLIEIGNHVTLTSEVLFVTHDGATWVFRDKDQYKNVIKYGKCVIKDNVFVGTRSTIMPGVTIGSNSVIGACSLVTKDVPDNEVWAGVPARRICSVDEYAEKLLKNTPEYDLINYKQDKKNTVLKMLSSKGEN